MKPPTELELKHLMGAYDPIKAHEYYVRTRKLKGRKPGQSTSPNTESGRGNLQDPRTGKTRGEITKNARAKQKQELQERIGRLSKMLGQLEAKIKEREHAAAREDRKGKAKKERAAKDRDKPKTAAEKAKDAREAEKYRDKHKQELKSKAKKSDSKSGGGSKAKGKSETQKGIDDLKRIATKVKGQIAVAKQKLAAL